MSGKISYRVAKMKLNFREEKPEVYKCRSLVFPPIKEDSLVEYICNSTNLPLSTVQACIMAIAEGIAYFVINGHRVGFESFGAFYLKVRSKTAATIEECGVDNVRGTTIGFMANTTLSDLARCVNYEKNKTLSVE